VIKKYREPGGHSPRWAAEPEKINKIYTQLNPGLHQSSVTVVKTSNLTIMKLKIKINMKETFS
jgi:hypothetical protein